MIARYMNTNGINGNKLSMVDMRTKNNGNEGDI